MEDSSLIRRFCSDGDTAAAAELLGKYERVLCNYLWQMLNHRQDCEDTLQETFAKALRALPRYREENHFKSWLFRIGHNEAINVIRRRKRTVVDEDPTAMQPLDDRSTAEATADEVVDQRERAEALGVAIGKLPDGQRHVLVLRMQSGLSFKEIARITGAPLSTVLGRMHKAKQRLKRLLEPILAPTTP